jgi:hypothetical protein
MVKENEPRRESAHARQRRDLPVIALPRHRQEHPTSRPIRCAARRAIRVLFVFHPLSASAFHGAIPSGYSPRAGPMFAREELP